VIQGHLDIKNAKNRTTIRLIIWLSRW